MKNIVILSAFLTPLRSGAEACAEEVPLALAKEFNFTIVTARMRRNLPKEDMLQGAIPIIRVGFGCRLDKWLYPFLAPLAVKKLQPDIVHAILETFAGLALALCKAPKKILTCQTTNRSFLKRFIVKSADHVTVISTVLEAIVSEYRIDPITKISNGIHLQQIHMACQNHKKILGRIVFVGRLEHMKGIDVLLEAMHNLPDHAHLHIVGDGSLRRELELKANLLKIGDRVSFVGYLPAPDVYKEYAEAQIFCGLSRSEALGNVFLEAQAAGCSVIGTNVGGIPDIIQDGTSGLLVPPDNVQAAHIALTQLLNDESFKENIVKAGKENASQYDWGEVAKEYAKLYAN